MNAGERRMVNAAKAVVEKRVAELEAKLAKQRVKISELEAFKAKAWEKLKGLAVDPETL